MTPDPKVTRAARQAAALWTHHARRDVAGLNVIIEEMTSGDDVTYLVLGLMNLFEYLLPFLLTPTGIELLSRTAADLANLEAGGAT